MEIRKAKVEDLDRIFEIYAYAREFMKQTGNPTQWGNNRPPRNTVIHDVEVGQSYVMVENNKVVGVFVFIIGKDPTYANIENGAWLNDDLYGTIHRIASDGTVKGVFKTCIAFCEKLVPNVRIDTHYDNKVMRSAITKAGFTECGTIYVDDGTPRVAYQKVVK